MKWAIERYEQRGYSAQWTYEALKRLISERMSRERRSINVRFTHIVSSLEKDVEDRCAEAVKEICELYGKEVGVELLEREHSPSRG